MITSLTQTKTILGLSTTTDDDKINSFIPLVESDFLRIRNRPFDVGATMQVTTGASADGTVIVTLDGFDYHVTVYAADSAVAVAYRIANYFSLSRDGDTVTFLVGYELSLDDNDTDVVVAISEIDTLYPTGAEITAIKMIAYHLSNIKSQGISSEMLGDYSVSYAVNGSLVGSYPESVTGGVRRYVGFA